MKVAAVGVTILMTVLANPLIRLMPPTPMEVGGDIWSDCSKHYRYDVTEMK